MRAVLSLVLLLLLQQWTVFATPHSHVAYNTIRPARNAPLPGRGHFTPSHATYTTPPTSASHYHPQSSLDSPSSSSTLRHPAGQRVRPVLADGPPAPSYCDAHQSPLYTALMGDYSTDMPGGDLPDQPVTLPASSTSVDCALLCLTTPQCVAWSYAPYSSYCNQTSDAQCFLKGKVAPQQPNQCMVSGPRLPLGAGVQINASQLFDGAVNVDRRNGDLLNFPLNGTSRDCAIECMKQSGCYHWVWEEPGDCTGNDSGFCWLKDNSTDAPASATCRTTGDSLLNLGFVPQPAPLQPPANPPQSLQQRLSEWQTHVILIGLERPNSPINMDGYGTTLLCALKCLDDDGCVGWYFDHSDGSTLSCHLMATVKIESAPNPFTHAEAGYPPAHRTDGILKGNVGSDRAGGDMPNMPVQLSQGSEAKDCGWLCLNTTGCTAWSFTPSAVNTSQPVSACPSLASPSTSVPGGCYLKFAVPGLSLDQCKVSGVAWQTLDPAAYPLLPSNTIKPLGWLKTQIELQTSGQAGSLPKFYCDVQHSEWLGGTCDGGFGERFPYWINGQLPGYYLINDTQGIAYAEGALEYVMAHQMADGWLKPWDHDPWGPSDMLFAFAYYYEHTHQPHIIDSILRFYRSLFTFMFQSNVNWASSYGWFYTRAVDYVVNLQWLLDNGLAAGQEQFVLDVMEMVRANGANYKYYVRCQFPTTPQYTFDYLDHGVNNGQAIKTHAIYARYSQDNDDYIAPYEHIAALDTYHGQATGMFSGDEFLAGRSPTRGIEVCAVAEAMFSYSSTFTVLGDVSIIDRLEQVAFNAMAATFTKDMTKHNYVQQPNMMISDWLPSMLTANVNEEGQTYGLDPDDGCCTANHPQGWTKFALAAFMQVQNCNQWRCAPSRAINVDTPGVAAVLLVPAEVNVTLPHPTYVNNTIYIRSDTDYPFQVTPTVTYHIDSQYDFPFLIRIPAWAVNATVTIPHYPPQPADAGYMFVYFHEGGNATVTLTMEARFRAERRYNNAVALLRGPMLFALPVSYTQHLYRPEPYNTDYFAFRPQSQWNYALVLNETTDDLDQLLAVREAPINLAMPFDTERPGLIVTAKARTVQWGVYRQVPEVAALSPVDSSLVFGESEEVQLVPYGQTLLRMTELPTISSDSLPSATPTRQCISSASASAPSNVTVQYTFDCSAWSNATANFNWTATLDSHTGLATFDGFQHWIDLFQPNNGVDTVFPSTTGGALLVSFTFYPARSQKGYCLLDVGAGVQSDNLQLCVEPDGKAVTFTLYDDTSPYKLKATANVTDGTWHELVAEVTSAGEMRLSLDSTSLASLTAVVPAVKARPTASVGRQSAPGNDGYGLFEGHIDTFVWSSVPQQASHQQSATLAE